MSLSYLYCMYFECCLDVCTVDSLINCADIMYSCQTFSCTTCCTRVSGKLSRWKDWQLCPIVVN